jgi:PAS domain S-box-containing protein
MPPAQTASGARLARTSDVPLRREALLVVVCSALLVIALSIVTLLLYRNATARFAEEQETHARRRVDRLLSELAEATGVAATEPALRALLPEAAGAALLDGDGLPLASAGDVPDVDALAPLRDAAAGTLARERIVSVGPNRATGPRLVVYASLGPELSPAQSLRVDFPAAALAAQRRTLPMLGALLLVVDSGLLLLVLAYVRRLLRPIDRMLDRARALSPPQSDRPDTRRGAARADREVELIVDAFDRALEALRERGGDRGQFEALREALASTVESGVLLLDQQGRVLSLNPPGRQLLGFSDESWQDRPLATALERHPGLAEELSRAVRQGAGRRRLEIATYDGGSESRLLGVTVSPLRRNDQSVRGFLVLFADLTSVKREAREHQLDQSLGQLGELTAGLAHELRNGLASLRGYLTLISRDERPETVLEYLAELRQETDHLHRVVEDFLSFARPGAVGANPVQVERLAHHAAADPALAASAVRVRVEPGAQGAVVPGDGPMLERALRNLLHNAARAQAAAGLGEPVTLRIRRGEAVGAGDATIEIAIEDRGAGLPQHVRDHLFVPFTSGGGGTGLGLALSRRIVQLHGGRLVLEDREGGGLVARMTLPAGTVVTESN